MRILRYILLIVSLIALAIISIIIYRVFTAFHALPEDIIVWIGIATALILNFIYIFYCPPQR